MRKLALLLAAAVMVTAVPAKASQFDYGSFAVDNGQNISIFSPVAEGVSAGMIVLTGAGPNAGQTIDAWCVDLFDHLQTSSIYNIVPLTTAGVGAPNPVLTAQQISELGSLMVHGTASVLGNTFGLDGSAAFQLAIWNVEYGGGTPRFCLRRTRHLGRGAGCQRATGPCLGLPDLQRRPARRTGAEPGARVRRRCNAVARRSVDVCRRPRAARHDPRQRKAKTENRTGIASHNHSLSARPPVLPVRERHGLRARSCFP